ncbi:MAG: 4-demethylwyosine synthase TYW1 [Thermoplasmata archaeon]|nr:4-demethylwyosine synthase TYW1 [Thermoplasmata archaeon]
MLPEVREMLRKQHYYLVGEHGAVKLCHWLKKKLTEGRACYKESFYGIQSHRCLQMTPVVDICNHACIYCWRYQAPQEWPPSPRSSGGWDDPKELIDGLIEGQRALLTGYKGNPKTDMRLWEEAQNPNQAAISLSGEPTLYPYLSELLEEFHKRGFTTFLVTNGTMPEVLENLDPLPTQLYISVDAPNERLYKAISRPYIKDGWERILKTLELLPSLDTRKVIRHTLIDGWNLGHVKEYAELDRIAESQFVEAKAYMFVGYSRQRMSIQNMPSFEKIKAFSKELAGELGYTLYDERPESRVTLLVSDPSTVQVKIPRDL